MWDNVTVLIEHTSGTPHHCGTPLENSGTPWGVQYTRLTSTGLQYAHLQQNRSRYCEHVQSQWSEAVTSHEKESHHASLQMQKICIAPLDSNSHPADLVNDVTGLISPEIVNAHGVVDIGNKCSL